MNIAQKPADLLNDIDLPTLSHQELMKLERQIANRHVGKTPWLAIAWGFSNLAVWLSLWPLVFYGVIPLWLGFVIATFNVAVCYLPSHEAQHDIVARPGEPLRWLNETLGHLSTIPLALPYRYLKVTHMEHHKHANNPELDPDYGTHAPNALAAIWQSIKIRQPRVDGFNDAYYEAAKRAGREDIMFDAIAYTLVFYSVLIALAWTGHAIEAALLWWLPRHIGLSYIQFYLSWAPHHPGKETGRYKDTKSFKSLFGNIGSSGMQHHIIHHLHPRIPLYRTPRAYWEMKPILAARGCDVHEL